MSTSVCQLEPILGPGWPLNSDASTLEQHHWIEREFRMSGQAARHRVSTEGREVQVVDEGHAYATRLLVRRPADPARCSGVVVLEWLNVSTGQDLDFVYGATRELLLRAGHVWVGASLQRVGVERLVAWNRERYAGLSVAAPADAPVDSPGGPGPLDPTDPFTGAAGGDVLCFDLLTQVGQLLRDAPAALTGGAAVRCCVAAGESQAAFRLSRYFNGLQATHGLFDGFLLYDRGGPFPLRSDLPARVIAMGSDFFSDYAGPVPSADPPNQRWWELAGASHVSLDEMAGYIDPQVLRDGTQSLGGPSLGLTELMAQAEPGAPGPLWSRVPNGDLMKAALRALVDWIGGGPAPRCAPRLQRDDRGQRLLDARGVTRGGIRYAAVEAPLSINLGTCERGPKVAGCHLDFTPAELRQAYGTPAAYVERVAEVVAANVAEGFLLEEEGRRVLAEARALSF